MQATYRPVWELVRVFAFDDAFLAALERVRAGSESSDQVARRYVRREGRPRRVMRGVIEQAATCTSSYPAFRVLSVAAVGVFVDAPLTDDDPRQWPHAKRHPEAARMLAHFGAGRCLACGTRLARDGSLRRYCGAEDALPRERADREAILGLLDGIGRALRI